MRITRIMALLLGLAIIAVSGYYYSLAPASLLIISVLPASLGALVSFYFWRTAPAKKKARRKAAAASLLLVPCILASAVLSLFFSPISIWQVYLCLATFGLMVACYAINRIRKKQSHPWADYYQEVA